MREIKESINKEWQNKSRNNVGGKYMIIIKNICQHNKCWQNFQEKLIKREKKDIKEYKEYNVYDNKE